MPCYDVDIPARSTPAKQPPHRAHRVALVGNPNAGKTSLFNALTGLRARTANFPGTTVERRFGRTNLNGQTVEVLDLPGMYSLRAATPEEELARRVLLGEEPGAEPPDTVVVMVDASNLERSLFLVSQILEHDLRVIVALNMVDVAERHGTHVDPVRLATELNCPVIPMVARTGEGVDRLKTELTEAIGAEAQEEFSFRRPESPCGGCLGCPFQARYAHTERIAASCSRRRGVVRSSRTEKIDEVLTHPVIGVTAFLAIMLGVFYLIFSVATIPMDMIDALFAHVGSWAASVMPEGALRSLLVDGVIGGVGGILVFLPQICILFFFLALLEDSGYLSRAAFVMDRLMRRLGLPGTAFVPLLSAHACAIPAIMATRVIRNRRDRLVTILVAPLMTCSARIPVYAMVTALLFPGEPGLSALVFTGAYALGIFAALAMAFVFKKTILPGESRPLVLELPTYRMPSLKSTLLYTWDRAKVFVSQAGTIILLISVALWFLASYPRTAPSPEVEARLIQAKELADAGARDEAAALRAQADAEASRYALAHSFAGRLGKWVEPVVRPLGFDWQIGIGVVTSFAAREVIVSTLAIIYGLGEEKAGDTDGLYATLRQARRPDGRAVFSTATSLSLLVFYVLAMQCLPTQAVTRRETGTWKWAILQFVYMTGLAYAASFLTYQGLRLAGLG